MSRPLSNRKFALTTLPPTDQSCTEEFAALGWRKALGLDRVVLQERVELRHELEEIAEGDETAVERPWWAHNRGSGAREDVAVAPAQDRALWDGLLARVRVRVKALDRRLRDAVQEAEAGWRAPFKRPIGKLSYSEHLLLVTFLITGPHLALDGVDDVHRRVECADVEDTLDKGLARRDGELTVTRNDDHSVDWVLEHWEPVGYEPAACRRTVVAEVLGVRKLTVVERAVINIVGDAELFPQH